MVDVVMRMYTYILPLPCTVNLLADCLVSASRAKTKVGDNGHSGGLEKTRR